MNGLGEVQFKDGRYYLGELQNSLLHGNGNLVLITNTDSHRRHPVHRPVSRKQSIGLRTHDLEFTKVLSRTILPKPEVRLRPHAPII